MSTILVFLIGAVSGLIGGLFITLLIRAFEWLHERREG